MTRSLLCIVSLVLATFTGGAEASEKNRRDLYFGEALFYAYQERYLDALERLDTELWQHYRVDEPQLDSLHHQVGHAEFSVGDFELHYRMHHRAGRAISAVLEGNVDPQVRNEAAFRLARIHFQKDQPGDALHALDRISGPVPPGIRDEIEFLRANAYMSLGRPAEAVDVLRRLQSSESLNGFSAYNLGIALLQAGQRTEALEQLERAGRLKGLAQDGLAIRDKSNLVRGALLMESSEFAKAQEALDRVRLEGPYSGQALLNAGWADASAENYRRALVPWSLLAERDVTDAAVQESLLALPYAYGRLNIHGRAAVLYGEAVEVFGGELNKLDASIRSIREGKFLQALAREEIRQNKDWVVRLRSLPDSPETFYLTALVASHDFQTALQNYLDLEDLRKRLASWQGSFDAFEDIIRHRRAYYQPLLPGVDHSFRELDSRIRLRLAQRESIDQRLHGMLIAPNPGYLATAGERSLLQAIAQLEDRLAEEGDSGESHLEERVRRLKGVLGWRLDTEYHERFTTAHENLLELNDVIDAMQARYQAYVRTRQAALHGFVGYDEQIASLRRRVARAQQELQVLMARQGHMLERVAINELSLRRQRLEAYQNQARYAFADSYDRATKAQAGEDQG